VSWGPRPRDYSQKINKKVKQLALRTALTGRINEADVIRVNNFVVADGKTRSFVAAVRAITDAKKVLIVGSFDEITLRAARNVAWVQMTRSEEVNAENLLNYGKVILTAHAMEVLARRTATNLICHERPFPSHRHHPSHGESHLAGREEQRICFSCPSEG